MVDSQERYSLKKVSSRYVKLKAVHILAFKNGFTFLGSSG